jgi:TonB-dependent starch-binding outer membrane protein SusC
MVSMMFSMLAIAQNKTVSGRVSDKDGRPLGDVTIKVKGTSVGTTTSSEGTFTIPIEGPESILSFSFVGYLSYETKVGTLSVFNIQLTASGKDMDDVIVVGYGTQKRSKLTGSVATIKAADIQDIPAQNIAGALRGRIAGVGVSQVSGRPGASITLNVRDAYSSDAVGGSSDEPLYVIDNMIVPKQTFDNLDPTMVEDITVLKDAQAAIYGASGAKGVILITTKKGKAGAPKLSYSGFAGVNDATKKPDMLSAYDHARLLNETYKINNKGPEAFFSDADLEYIRTMPNYNWFDEMWQPALTQRHSLNLSGGSENITFFLGGGYQNQNANYAGLKNDRFTLRSGITAKLTNSISAEVMTNVDHNVRRSKNPWDERDQSFLENLIQIPRWTPIKIGDKYINYANSGNTFSGNPFGLLDSGYYDESKTRSYGINASLVWAPKTGILKGLTARVQASQTGNNTRNETYSPTFTVYNFVRTGNNKLLYSDSLPIDVTTGLPSTASEQKINDGDKSRLSLGQNENSSYRVVFTLQYQKKIGDHDFSIMAGAEQSEGRGKGQSYYYIKQQVPDNPYFWAFDQAPIFQNPSATQSGKRSYFGRFSYNYKGKYTLDGITRADASSNFAANHIWGVFPSFGAGWIVSSEPFFDKVPYITYLKLRTNIGLTGEDRVADRFWQERYKVIPGSYLYGDTYVTGIRPDVIPNPDITWEKKRTVNVGIDLSLFNNKLSLTFDAFQNYGYDIFDKGVADNFPMYVGFATPVVNNIKRYNWGTEYSISYHANLAKDLQLKAGMNFSYGNSVITQMFYNRNKLWEQAVDEMQDGFGTDPRTYNSSNYGLKAAGIFRSQEEVDAFLSKNPNYTINGKVPEPGWLYYKDIDGDGLISARDKTTMFKRINPAFATGIQLALTYKNWEWRTNIAARIGGKVFYDSKARKGVPTDAKNVPAWWTDGWTVDNPNSRLPRIDDPFVGTESDFWAVNGTMIRVNDMTISYAAPKEIVRFIGLNSVRFVLTGNNLWVLKNPLKYKDPYQSSIYDYPTIRTMSAGLNLGF